MISDTDARRHEDRIESLLARKALASGYDVGARSETYTPLDALLRSEEAADDEDEKRSECIACFIDFLLQDGMHPARVMKNFYAAVHALRPQALPGEWTCEDFAALFGETRAAHSWRVKQLFSKRLEAAGKRPVKARFQKASGATANYAQAQKGNSNRRHGLPRAAA